MTTTHLYIVAKDSDSFTAFLESHHWIDANRCIHVDPCNPLASVYFAPKPLVIYLPDALTSTSTLKLAKHTAAIFFKGARILELPKD